MNMHTAHISPSINNGGNIPPGFVHNVFPKLRPNLTLVTGTRSAPALPNLTLAGVRKMVIKSYMESAATTEHKSFPYVSANTSFDNVGFAGETAASLNKALRNGSRGLSCDAGYLAWVDSLPSDVTPTLRSFIQHVLTPKASFVKFVRATLSGLDKLEQAA